MQLQITTEIHREIFFLLFAAEYAKAVSVSTTSLDWQAEFLTIMMLFAALGLGVSMVILGVNLHYPNLPILLSSVVTNIEEQPVWVHLILGVPSVLFTLSVWASAVVVGVIFYFPEYANPFVLREMR